MLLILIMNFLRIIFLIYCASSSNIICLLHCLPILVDGSIRSFSATDIHQQELQQEEGNEEKLVIEKLANIIHNQHDRQQYNSAADGQLLEQQIGGGQQYEDFPENIVVNRPIVREDLSLYPDPATDTGEQLKTFDIAPRDTEQQRYIKVDAKASIPTKFQRNDPNVEYESKFQKQEVTPNSDEDGSSIEKTNQSVHDSIQRKKLYSYLTQNPSFIPYGHAQSAYIPKNHSYYEDRQTTNILAITYGSICGILVITIFSALLFYRKLKKKVKDAEDVDYPAYGVTGPSKEITAATGDRHLAHSAQMYHYQHQKQQIKAMENVQKKPDERRDSDSASDEDDFTVYECPGLATTGEMEVKNPMFQDEIIENNVHDKDKLESTITTDAAKNGKQSIQELPPPTGDSKKETDDGSDKNDDGSVLKETTKM